MVHYQIISHCGQVAAPVWPQQLSSPLSQDTIRSDGHRYQTAVHHQRWQNDRGRSFDIETFERIEELLEGYRLARYMEEIEEEESLSLNEARQR